MEEVIDRQKVQMKVDAEAAAERQREAAERQREIAKRQREAAERQKEAAERKARSEADRRARDAEKQKVKLETTQTMLRCRGTSTGEPCKNVGSASCAFSACGVCCPTYTSGASGVCKRHKVKLSQH
jgi:hypothetical protein